MEILAWAVIGLALVGAALAGVVLWALWTVLND